MKERSIPKKNYFILMLLLVAVVILTFAVVSVCKGIKSSNVASGYINKYVNELSYNELDTYLVEPSSNTFVYVTYTGDEQIYKLEKNLKKIIANNELNDEFIYMNVTKEMENDNFMNELNNKFSTDKINKLPIILYFKDGVLLDVVSSNDNLFTGADFQKLLDNYEIAN